MAKRKKRGTKRKRAPRKRTPMVVGLRELARQLDVAHRAVQLALEDGRIADAVVERPSGPGRPYKIDAAKAKRLWKERTDSTHRPDDELEERKRRAQSPGADDDAIGPGLQEDLPLKDESDTDMSWGRGRARREAAQARLKEVEVDSDE